MRDDANPTHAEIEAWARTPDAMYPTEDWDLLIAKDENAGLFVRLASDSTCANREAVLNFLYVYAGQVAREGFTARSVDQLRAAVHAASTASQADVRLWAQRAAALLDGRGEKDHAFWFQGGWRR